MKSEFPLIETQKLILRQPDLSDAKHFHELLSIDKVTELTDIPKSPSDEVSERYVTWMSKLYSRGTGCGWVICMRDSNEVIGAIRINEMYMKTSYGEIGYELHPTYWNQGVMTEAVAAVTDCGHATFKLNRMEAWVIPGNIGSEAVLKKNGYDYEGTLRQRLNLRGKLCDIKMYSHLK